VRNATVAHPGILDCEEGLEKNVCHRLVMAFKLLEMAETRWRRINGAQLVPLVRAGVKFIDGAEAESRSAA
jgi:hypothetical protein